MGLWPRLGSLRLDLFVVVLIFCLFLLLFNFDLVIVLLGLLLFNLRIVDFLWSSIKFSFQGVLLKCELRLSNRLWLLS